MTIKPKQVSQVRTNATPCHCLSVGSALHLLQRAHQVPDCRKLLFPAGAAHIGTSDREYYSCMYMQLFRRASGAGNELNIEDGGQEGADGAGLSNGVTKKESTMQDVKKEADEKDKAGEGDDDEETYELDASQLLTAFKAEEEKPEEPEMDPEALMKIFMDDMKEVDRSNEVHRILAAFKLNPFEQLNLRFTATEQEVKRAYRCCGKVLLYLFILVVPGFPPDTSAMWSVRLLVTSLAG